MICEIKKEACYKEINSDVKKLFTYMNYSNMHAHPYPLAVFINVGPSDTFKKNLKKTSFQNPLYGSLVFISYDKGEAVIIKKITGKGIDIIKCN